MSPHMEALLKNPTVEGALKFWDYRLLGEPKEPLAPLAGVHKARLSWPKSTKAMVKESRRWLSENGYGPRPGYDKTAPAASPHFKRS